MEFKNPKVDNQVNYSTENPLKSFAQLSVGVIAIVAVVMLVLHFLAGYFVRYIPFSFEKDVVAGIEQLAVEASTQQAYLQDLADKVSGHMDLPEDMTITVHYIDQNIVNAFATLGGHVFFYRGLIEKLDSENALAMVMAHEIAHIQHRHPVTALSKGLTVMLAGAAVSGYSGSSAGDMLIGNTLNFSLLKFSREQETQSDETALKAINSLYGHVAGAQELFLLFAKISNESGDSLRGAELFRSHPYSINRWHNLEQLANENGWSVEGELTELTIPK